MTKVNNNGVYIRTVEAAMIWEYHNRGSVIKNNYTGYIPHSLELIKLNKEGLDKYAKRLMPVLDDKGNEVKNEKGNVRREPKNVSVKEIDSRTLKNVSRIYTDDVINIKFKSKVNNMEAIIKKIKSKYSKKIKVVNGKYECKMSECDAKIEALQVEWKKEIERLVKERDSKIEDVNKKAELNTEIWDMTIPLDELRTLMYEKGFKLNNYKGEEVHYLPYKRSSSKARTGEILFIRKELHEVMSTWSQMGLEIKEGMKIDLAAWGAYLALVSSSIESTIKINPKNILLVDDVESVFKREAITINKVEDEQGNPILKSVINPDATIKNSLFDGQGLLDSSYYTGQYQGVGMIQTRQAFFKSCLFNTNIQQFMRDQFKDTYDTATVTDLLGNKIKVKDIHCIITPSSLKIFKFSNLVGTDKQMYKHWQKIVREEKCIFGVCKSEYESKRGSLDGMPLNQMSYQMINSLPLTEEMAIKLSEYEVNYINDMKNNNDKFIEHLKENAALTNSNQMIVDLYNRNSAIAKTDLFIEFKTNTISEYCKHIRKGKPRITGDYGVIVGNPYEMLLHSIKKLDLHNLKSHTLQDNEVFTPLFKDGEEVAGFRNPHTSKNNLLYAKNVHNELINTYFNLTNNTVAVNLIDFPLQDILSGSDQDGDTVLLTNNEIIVDIARDNTANVCLNNVPSQSNKYELNPQNLSKVDMAIASDIIGRIVNTGQAAQSIMSDALHNNDEELANKMKEATEIISVGSTIAIDLAKKSYSIDIEKELERLEVLVKDNLKTDKYNQPCFPLFMQQKSKRTKYDTAMDYVFKKFKVEANNEGGIEKAECVKVEDKVNIMDLVIKHEVAKSDDKQENKIIEMVNEYTDSSKLLRKMIIGDNATDSAKKLFAKELSLEASNFQYKMSKRNIKPATVYAMLYHLFCKESINSSAIKVMNAIYLSNPSRIINIFMQGK